MRSIDSPWCCGIIATGALAIACNDQARSSEQAYVEREVGKLEAALAAGAEPDVVGGCVSALVSLDHMPAPLADKIRRLCHVEAPRLHLQRAIAAVTRENAAHPELADLNCFQLFAGDAFKTLAQHPPADPSLRQLVDEYTRLCPARVARFRGE